jgi:hypothetical protein
VIHELRVYEPVPGKLPALHRRFRDVSIGLFERHGIRVVGFWDTYIGPGAGSSLTYLLEFDDLAHRESAWDAFQKDPEWQQARAESERDGPLVARITNSILRPTAYSPLK